MAFTYGSVTNCKVGNGTTRSEYQCRLGYQVNSQSIENNTSNVTLRLEVRSISSSYATYGYNQTSTIDGTSLSAKSFDMRSTNTWKVFGERTITITHNANGTYSANKSGSFTTTATGTYSLKSGSASVNVAPATIPRASQPTLSNGSINIGSTTTVYMNRVSTAFTHYVYAVWGDKRVEIGSNIANEVNFTLPMNFCDNIPSSTSGTGTIYVDTYSGGTYIGTKAVGFTGYVPDSVQPGIGDINISEGNTNVPNWGCFIQGKSTLNINIGTWGAYSSWITSCKVTGIDNNTYWSSNFTSSVLQISGTRTITVTVTDSRGRTASKTATYTCVPYGNPSISVASVIRCNSDGTANEEGEYVKYTFKASVSSVNNKNTYAYKIGYKKNTDYSYTYITIENSSYSLDKSDVVISDMNFSVDYSYDFQFLVSDYFTSTTNEQHIATGFTLMDFRSTGKGMAIGKVSEKDAFEVDLPSIIRCLELYWKEDGYGDKFKIVSNFNGFNDENKLKIMGAVGDAGTDPDLYDLMTISGKSGNVWIKGNLGVCGTFDIDNSIICRGSYTFQNGCNITTNSWNDLVMNALSWAYIYAGDSSFTFRSDGLIDTPQGFVQCKPVIAYNNASGTSGTVTLSTSADNYNHIRITYKNDDGQYNTTTVSGIDSAQGDFFGTIIRKSSSNDSIMINSAIFGVYGSTISISRNSQANIYLAGSSANDPNQLYITKVELWN